jgi:hypothetical protein
MAHTIQGSPQPGTRQIAVLKHYRLVCTSHLMPLQEAETGSANSFLFPSLSNEVHVPEEVFSTLHAMEDAAVKLELDFFHIAVSPSHRQKVSRVINDFRNKQPTFAEDKIARDCAVQQLQSTTDETTHIIESFGLQSVMRDASLTQPREGSNSPEVKGNRPRIRWEFGINPQTLPNVRSDPSTGRLQRVMVPGATKAYQCLLLAKVTKAGVVNLNFTISHSGSYVSWPSSEENEYTYYGLARIIGWTLSCNNVQGEWVRFCCTGGGIGNIYLGSKAWAPRGREFHCRVTFIED